MTITTTDIKLRTPERLTDLADGGGRADIEGMPDAPTIPSEFADALDV